MPYIKCTCHKVWRGEYSSPAKNVLDYFPKYVIPLLKTQVLYHYSYVKYGTFRVIYQDFLLQIATFHVLCVAQSSMAAFLKPP